MSLQSFIPKGFKLVAVTELSGTGGTTVRAYVNPERREVYLRISYVILVPGIKVIEERELSLGPVPFRLLESIQTTLTDVADMRGGPLRFLE